MDKRVLKTRKAIYDAFDNILKTKKINEITVTEIANVANIDRKTFYAHHQSIAALVRTREDAVELDGIEILNNLSPFNADDYIDALTDRMIDQIDIYTLIAKNREYAPMIQDAKDMMVRNWRTYFIPKSDISTSEFEDSLNFLAAGLIDHYVTWLATPKQAKEKLDLATKIMKEIFAREIKLIAAI